MPEACIGAVCSSFLLVESTFAGRGYPTVTEGFETVVAHELFHAVQNAYDHDMDRFWAEGSAQWAMKIVYPGRTDFENQLPAFFKDNTRSLDTQPAGVSGCSRPRRWGRRRWRRSTPSRSPGAPRSRRSPTA